jgi:hypothetical protein
VFSQEVTEATEKESAAGFYRDSVASVTSCLRIRYFVLSWCPAAANRRLGAFVAKTSHSLWSKPDDIGVRAERERHGQIMWNLRRRA